MIITITKDYRPTKTCIFLTRNSGLNFENYISYLSELIKPSFMLQKSHKSFHIRQNSQNLLPCRTELSKLPFIFHRTLKTSLHIAQNSQNPLLSGIEFSTTPQNIAVRVLTAVLCVMIARTLVSGYQVRKDPAASIRLKMG